jgi:predicted nucleic acid-binding protein
VIAIDSSVWINLWRARETRSSMWLRANAGNDQIVTLDIVMYELLQGARDDMHAGKLARFLTVYPVRQVLTADSAVGAASHSRRLRNAGVTPRSAPDVLIATWCVANHALLLHDDRDYDVIAPHIGLRVL